MGSDGLLELDQSCWLTLAKYNLLLATLFGALAVSARAHPAAGTALVVENAVLSLTFGAVQTYAWLSA